MREALFLTFNVDLGFFETRLLGPVKAAGAAVTVIADASVFAPDPRSVRGAGYAYTLGLAATARAFHPKLTVLVGTERALVGIGSGNLTVGGWHSNEEVLTTVRASRTDGAPVILRDVLEFLRGVPQQTVLSPLAVEGVVRTGDRLAALLESAEPIDTGHALMDTVQGPLVDQLPLGPVDALEISAPFHDLGARALAHLLERYAAPEVTVLAQRGRAVMNPEAMERVARAAGSRLSFVQVASDEELASRYRHGKVVTALRGGRPVWTVVGSPNLSAAAFLHGTPSGNVELAVLHRESRSLLPTPRTSVADSAALRHTIATEHPDVGDVPAGTPVLLEARALSDGTEVVLSRPAAEDLVVEVSPFDMSPDTFRDLGCIRVGDASTRFEEQFGPGTRLRVGSNWQFLAFPDQVVGRLQATGATRPNHDATYADIFASEASAQQWLDALERLLQSHSGAGRPGVTHAATSDTDDTVTASWRTLDDADAWGSYAEDALARLGMPIFRLASGTPPVTSTVGATLPNAAPAWEDRFEQTEESYEEGETAESAEELDEAPVVEPPTSLSAYQRTRLRRWVHDAVGLMPSAAPYERIALCQLAIVGSTASIWDETDGPAKWFNPLAEALDTMDAQPWPTATVSQAAAITALGLYRLQMAVPSDERGREAVRFAQLAKRLAPLTQAAPPDAVSANLGVLAGATQVTIEAQDVLAELALRNSPDERAALARVIGRSPTLSGFDASWLDDCRLLLRGRTTNPRTIAVEVLKLADRIERVAIGVVADSGMWAVVGKVPNLAILVEGGDKPTKYKTYDTKGMVNAAAVLADQDFNRHRRMSRPPWTRADSVDLEVLNALGLNTTAVGGMDQ